jgi:hypothetical protein
VTWHSLLGSYAWVFPKGDRLSPDGVRLRRQ